MALPIEIERQHHLWRWVGLVLAIFIILLGLMFAWNKAPHKQAGTSDEATLPLPVRADLSLKSRLMLCVARSVTEPQPR